MRIRRSKGDKKVNAELKQFLDTQLREDTDTNTISVFPLPCGVGKSEYIQYVIADALHNNYGLIIVTDAVDRLNSYMDSKQNDQLVEYINRNRNRISILSSDNILSEIRTLQFKPIVLMTTQRYFNLSRDEIINFTSGQNYKRSKIIFDEKIYLLESRTLTIKSLDNIAIALKESLDNTVNQDDKQWLINQYSKFNYKLQEKLKENEQLNNDTQNFKREVYFNADGLTISEDDAKFQAFIEKYKYFLIKNNPDILKDLKAIYKLLSDGAVTSQKIKNKSSNKDYKNYFTVVTNNANKLIDIGAKVFVLDGTSDISPEYRLKCVNMVDCSQFKKDLSKLTINIINVNTSKDRLTRKGDKTEHLIQAIIDYIKAQPLNIETVFTYQAIEDKIKREFKNVEHFGNIKGSNDYREVNHICQIGINRWPELVYMLYANEIGQYNHPDRSFNHRTYDKETIDNIRCSLILADIEQNLFRCKIRNPDNTEECTYTLICSTSEKTDIFENYHPLVNMIKARYEPSGATVNVIDTPIEFKLLKAEERKQDTNVQKILNWLSSHIKDYVFEIDDMLNDLNLNQRKFQKIKSKNPAIKELFKQMRITKGVYKIL